MPRTKHLALFGLLLALPGLAFAAESTEADHADDPDLMEKMNEDVFDVGFEDVPMGSAEGDDGRRSTRAVDRVTFEDLDEELEDFEDPGDSRRGSGRSQPREKDKDDEDAPEIGMGDDPDEGLSEDPDEGFGEDPDEGLGDFGGEDPLEDPVEDLRPASKPAPKPAPAAAAAPPAPAKVALDTSHAPLTGGLPATVVGKDVDAVVVELPVLVARSSGTFAGGDYWLVAEFTVGGKKVGEARHLVTRAGISDLAPTVAWLKAQVPVIETQGSVEVKVSQLTEGSAAKALFTKKVQYTL